VLDPFGGSFTTAVVAAELERSSIVIEGNPEYFAMGLARMAQHEERTA
jgi:DNA modification methylase